MTLVVILETAPGSILRESNDIEGIKCILAAFIVIDGGNGGLALGDVAVAVGISRAAALSLRLGVEGRNGRSCHSWNPGITVRLQNGIGGHNLVQIH